MNSFADARNEELRLLSESNDVEFLKKELVKAEKLMPYCAAESFFRTNKILVISNAIKKLTQ